MQRKVKAVRRVHMQSLHIDFEDGTMAVIGRNDAADIMPEVGKMWPPVPVPQQEAVKPAAIEAPMPVAAASAQAVK